MEYAKVPLARRWGNHPNRCKSLFCVGLLTIVGGSKRGHLPTGQLPVSSPIDTANQSMNIWIPRAKWWQINLMFTEPIWKRVRFHESGLRFSTQSKLIKKRLLLSISKHITKCENLRHYKHLPNNRRRTVGLWKDCVWMDEHWEHQSQESILLSWVDNLTVNNICKPNFWIEWQKLKLQFRCIVRPKIRLDRN